MWLDFISEGKKDPKDELLLSFSLQGFNISKGFSERVLRSLKSEKRLELKLGKPQLQQCQEIRNFREFHTFVLLGPYISYGSMFCKSHI